VVSILVHSVDVIHCHDQATWGAPVQSLECLLDPCLLRITLLVRCLQPQPDVKVSVSEQTSYHIQLEGSRKYT
jgi:hypothetical protein